MIVTVGLCVGFLIYLEMALIALSFPLFFVFRRAGVMLPGFPRVEPDATHPETASVTGSLAWRRVRL